MILKINSSGSQGNNAILKDKYNNQLIIDCGIKIEKFISDLNFKKVDGCLITHCHKDHSLSKDKLKFYGVDIYDHDNLQDGKVLIINKHWQIIPMSVKHNVDNFAFMIVNILENKKILWCTDLMKLPKINPNIAFDLMALEVNFDKQSVFEKSKIEDISSHGYKFHNSLENTMDFLNKMNVKPKHFVGIHLSNSELLNLPLAQENLNSVCKNSKLATKEMELEF